MAAGPADAFSTTPRGFGCYDRELISAAADNLWSSSVVATASTGASWVDEVHTDPIDKRVEELKRKFHRGRQLQIKHLPREVTEEEIRELLAEWDVQSVTVQSGSARVALCSPEMLEDWDRNAVFTLRGQRVTIVPSPTEMLLCVGRLPSVFNQQQFNALVSCYGEVKRAFLMISERTGESKGYGFVEYLTKEAALQAKNALDGRMLGDGSAVCDWLDSSHVTLRSLHSKCLYVDRLPPNYRDMGEFRRIFSTIVNPPYCQIALRNGCPQDWGLVEFLQEDDAERTQQQLDGFILHGHRIRVAFYIPGVRAINLYLKLLNDGGNNKGKSALLPDPPAPAVFHQLQSLAKQNPVFAQNLQSIILQQIQDVQKGKGPVENGPGKRPPFSKTPPYGPSSPNPALLKNAQQTALTLLLASHMHNNGGGNSPSTPNSAPLSPNSSSNLHNQQLLSALQAMSKGSNGGSSGGSHNSPEHFLHSGASPPNLSSLLALAPQSGGISGLDNSGNLPHGLFSNPALLLAPASGNGHNGNGNPKEDTWNSYKSSRSSSFGSGGLQKSPLLPSPEGVRSPSIDVPMDTGMSAPRTPPGDPLQAVWYSLFGHSSPPDSESTSPGNTSPLFMKSPMSSNAGSPIGHRGSSDLRQEHPFGVHKSSPPGFSTPNGHHFSGPNRPPNGDLQEAINSLLSNPQNLTHLLGSSEGSFQHMGQGPQGMNTSQSGMGHDMRSNLPPHLLHLSRSGALGHPDTGMSSTLLDLLMQSMQSSGGAPHPNSDNFLPKGSAWSSGLSSPPSPIGNHRPYNNSGVGPPQRSGSNGSSEMRSASPRSPTFSPFSRHSKGLLESGNGTVSPTPQPWTTSSVLGSPPSTTHFGGQQTHPSHHMNSFQSRSIWASSPSLSPTANPSNNNHLINPLGQKRKVHHDTNIEDGGFLSLGPSIPPAPAVPTPPIPNHYADSYFKKKKKT